MNDRGVYRRLDAHRQEIDTLLEAGAKKVDIARAMNVKTTTLSGWLVNRDLGEAQSDSEVQEALRRLAESVGA